MDSGREKFKRHRGAIGFCVKLANIFPLKFRRKSLEFFQNTRGVKGILIRYILLKTVAKSCGDNVSVHPNVFLKSPQNLEIGDNVSIHPMCYIDATGGIQIGNNVSIAHAVTVLSTNHTWGDRGIPIKYNTERLDKTFIQDDIWIGCGSRILAGVTVCNRSIIAAGAVVTGEVHGDTIVGGVPAEIIGRTGDKVGENPICT